MIRLWHEASRRLRSRARSTAEIGAALVITNILCILAGSAVQTLLDSSGMIRAGSLSAAPNRADLFLAAALLTAAAALTPLRMQCGWQLGALSGTLDENDQGFLAQSGSLWLWGRAWAVRLLMDITVLLSALPALLLYLAAKSIWLRIPPADEGLLPLLTVLHLGMLALAAAYLPLRTAAARTALPFCYLKLPHIPPVRVVRMAMRVTRHRTPGIILMRLLSLPLILLPVTAVRALPVLLTAEQIRTERAWRQLRPRRVSRFADMELHAYDTSAGHL